MSMFFPAFWLFLFLWVDRCVAGPLRPGEQWERDNAGGELLVSPSDPRIFYTGRWDANYVSWWTTSGIKLHFSGSLTSVSLHLGNMTTSPFVAVAMSVDYAPFVTLQLTNGTNPLPIKTDGGGSHIVRLNVEDWMNNRLHLEGVGFNGGATLEKYKPSPLVFEFIGDSLLSGQYTAQTGVTSWGFLVGETFKAEHNSIAQPGECLTGQCWGNPQGMVSQYWQTEDSNYAYIPSHANFTTPWNFSKQLAPTHVILQLGANDAGWGREDAAAFSKNYLTFIRSLRTVYPTQPIIDWWGWPSPTSSVNQPIFPGVAEEVVQRLHEDGDSNVWYVPTAGWVTYADVVPIFIHPSTEGSKKIATLFSQYIQSHFDIKPEGNWATQVS